MTSLVKKIDEARIAFRIKPIPESDRITSIESCDPNNKTCQNLKASANRQYDVYNTSGQYYIAIQKYETPNDGVIVNIIKTLREYFFKTSDNESKQGAVQEMFRSLMRDVNFIEMVRAILLFYIAFTGISYLAGFAQITQQDGLIRIFKIGIIIALLSENSFDFFNQYLFSIFLLMDLWN